MQIRGDAFADHRLTKKAVEIKYLDGCIGVIWVSENV